jgi:hypothetical protein
VACPADALAVIGGFIVEAVSYNVHCFKSQDSNKRLDSEVDCEKDLFLASCSDKRHGVEQQKHACG